MLWVGPASAPNGPKIAEALTSALLEPIGRTEIEARKSHAEQPLNEVSQLTELAAMRLLLAKQKEPVEE